jgi:hypothetical protein
MINITQLGAFHIPYLVSEWNKSEDTELKNQIRLKILSLNGFAVLEGVAKIKEIFNKSMAANDSIRSIECLDHFVFGPLFGELTQSEDQERTGLANRDVAFYFTNMFEAGHFEKMPPPAFGYEKPKKD